MQSIYKYNSSALHGCSSVMKTAFQAVWSLESFPVVTWDVNSLLYKARERRLLTASLPALISAGYTDVFA